MPALVFLGIPHWVPLLANQEAYRGRHNRWQRWLQPSQPLGDWLKHLITDPRDKRTRAA
jgi:hypothetical protein